MITRVVLSCVPVFPAFSYRVTTALAFRQNRTSVSGLDLSVNMPATILPVSTNASVLLDLNSQPTMQTAKTSTNVNVEFVHNNVPTRKVPMNARVFRDTDLTLTEPLAHNALLHISEKVVVECVNAGPGWTGVTPLGAVSACLVGQDPVVIRISTSAASTEASVAQTKYVITIKEAFNVNVDKVIEKCKPTV